MQRCWHVTISLLHSSKLLSSVFMAASFSDSLPLLIYKLPGWALNWNSSRMMLPVNTVRWCCLVLYERHWAESSLTRVEGKPLWNFNERLSFFMEFNFWIYFNHGFCLFLAQRIWASLSLCSLSCFLSVSPDIFWGSTPGVCRHHLHHR